MGRTRGLAAQDQLCGSDPGPKGLAAPDGCGRVRNQKGRRRRVGHGRRWLAGIVFPSPKRMSGGSVNAAKMGNAVQEIATRISTHGRRWRGRRSQGHGRGTAAGARAWIGEVPLGRRL